MNGDAFTIEPVAGGAILSMTWDLTDTSYAITHVSVNFDNNFYHLYTINTAQDGDSAIFLTGNQLDTISHVRFFGVRVPDGGTSGLLLGISMIGIVALRRKLFSAA